MEWKQGEEDFHLARLKAVRKSKEVGLGIRKMKFQDKTYSSSDRGE